MQMQRWRYVLTHLPSCLWLYQVQQVIVSESLDHYVQSGPVGTRLAENVLLPDWSRRSSSSIMMMVLDYWLMVGQLLR
jgi:hypothetical protein